MEIGRSRLIWAHLESTTVSGLAVRRNVGLGSPTNSQPGRLRYVAQASGLRVLAASGRQFWWYLQDAPPSQRINYSRLNLSAREDLPGAISPGIIQTS